MEQEKEQKSGEGQILTYLDQDWMDAIMLLISIIIANNDIMSFGGRNDP